MSSGSTVASPPVIRHKYYSSSANSSSSPSHAFQFQDLARVLRHLAEEPATDSLSTTVPTTKSSGSSSLPQPPPPLTPLMQQTLQYRDTPTNLNISREQSDSQSRQAAQSSLTRPSSLSLPGNSPSLTATFTAPPSLMRPLTPLSRTGSSTPTSSGNLRPAALSRPPSFNRQLSSAAREAAQNLAYLDPLTLLQRSIEIAENTALKQQQHQQQQQQQQRPHRPSSSSHSPASAPMKASSMTTPQRPQTSFLSSISSATPVTPSFSTSPSSSTTTGTPGQHQFTNQSFIMTTPAPASASITISTPSTLSSNKSRRKFQSPSSFDFKEEEEDELEEKEEKERKYEEKTPDKEEKEEKEQPVEEYFELLRQTPSRPSRSSGVSSPQISSPPLLLEHQHRPNKDGTLVPVPISSSFTSFEPLSFPPDKYEEAVAAKLQEKINSLEQVYQQEAQQEADARIAAVELAFQTALEIAPPHEDEQKQNDSSRSISPSQDDPHTTLLSYYQLQASELTADREFFLSQVKQLTISQTESLNKLTEQLNNYYKKLQLQMKDKLNKVIEKEKLKLEEETKEKEKQRLIAEEKAKKEAEERIKKEEEEKKKKAAEEELGKQKAAADAAAKEAAKVDADKAKAASDQASAREQKQKEAAAAASAAPKQVRSAPVVSQAAREENAVRHSKLVQLRSLTSAFVADKSRSTTKLQLTIFINRTITQISQTMKSVIEKANQLGGKLAELKRDSSKIQEYAYALETMAVKLVGQGDTRVKLQNSSAFSFAAVAYQLGQLELEFNDIFLALLCEKCCYCIPTYIIKTKDMDMRNYQLAMGYNEITEDDPSAPGKERIRFEDEDAYLERMCGFICLFSAYLQFPSSKHPYGIDKGWIWISRLLNQSPRSATGSVLLTFLSTAGFALFQNYPNQTKKLLEFIVTIYVPMLPISTPARKAAVTRLDQWVRNQLNMIRQRGSIEEPEGRTLPAKQDGDDGPQEVSREEMNELLRSKQQR